MTFDEIHALLAQINYKPGWGIALHMDGDRPYLQIHGKTLDSRTLEPSAWVGRKVFLSFYMCRQEIVGAAFGAIEAAEMHEVREFFRYRGVSIFNPHLDPDALVEVASKAKNFCVRADSMTKA